MTTSDERPEVAAGEFLFGQPLLPSHYFFLYLAAITLDNPYLKGCFPEDKKLGKIQTNCNEVTTTLSTMGDTIDRCWVFQFMGHLIPLELLLHMGRTRIYQRGPLKRPLPVIGNVTPKREASF